jgi:L,D-peptidoglycan transpeptidase YkuD (ErfK/YbiS/YcfS/YnhG family)
MIRRVSREVTVRRAVIVSVALAAAALVSGALAVTTSGKAEVVAMAEHGRPLARPPAPGVLADARQVITVISRTSLQPEAALQAWTRTAAGWVRTGPQQVAHVGRGGITSFPREGVSASPAGSYTLTFSFGILNDPGTALPFVHISDSDWWISEPGRLYNTFQQCAIDCPFQPRSPNSHLIETNPAYDYAVAIDYNRHPVVQGAGSAYFLHVTTAGTPTHGCISVRKPAMKAILQWLNPADHPRIMIAVLPGYQP